MFSELVDDQRETNSRDSPFFWPLSITDTGQQSRSCQGCSLLLKDTSAAASRRRDTAARPPLGSHVARWPPVTDTGAHLNAAAQHSCQTMSSTGARHRKNTTDRVSGKSRRLLKRKDSTRRSCTRGSGNYSELHLKVCRLLWCLVGFGLFTTADTSH